MNVFGTCGLGRICRSSAFTPFSCSKRHYAFQSNLIIGSVSPTLTVPKHIVRPPVHQSAPPLTIKTEEQIKNMRKTCKLAANILNFACEAAQVSKHGDQNFQMRSTHLIIIHENDIDQ